MSFGLPKRDARLDDEDMRSHGTPSPPEFVVSSGEEPCSYIDGQVARRPLRLPLRVLDGDELDARLARGDRRAGPFFYNQECPSCRACEPLRIDVARFEPSRTQKRVHKRGLARFHVEKGPLLVDRERVELFNKHRELRGLTNREGPASSEQYSAFLVERLVDAFELRYRLDGALVGVAVVDRGATAWSAVYTYYDPDHEALSPGTFSILEQVARARAAGVRWLYLGLAIAENSHMRYKLGFLPHERRIDGIWQRFERERDDRPLDPDGVPG